MLRSLARNGIAHRYQLSRHRHHAYVVGNIRSISVARKSTSSSRAILHLCQRTTYPQSFFLPARSFSAPPSTTSKSKDTSSVHTIPHPSVKHKVELRPGPKKPPTTPSSSHTPKVKQLPTADPSPPLQSTPITAKPSDSIVETVKEDLKHAYIHGVLARPPPDAGKLATLWHQAKELFKFYFRGLKLVITHRKQAKEIQARVKAGGEPLSRWESRFLRTNKSDLARLVPFVAIVLVLEEVIPLIVLYAPGMLPSTCILASQRERIDAKRREKQRAFAETMRGVFSDVYKAGPTALASSLPSTVSSTALCGKVTFITVIESDAETVFGKRVERHMKSVVADDALLVKEGMGDRLTHPELLEALEERGILTDGLNTAILKARLYWWLTNSDRTDEGTATSRRITLAAQSALDKFQ